MSVSILIGDCRERMAELDADSIDSCVTDPPYHLTSIVKRFGAANAAPAKAGKTGAYARASKGFMGQTWDGGDVAFQPETWAEVLRVLKPGGHLVAFSGCRTYHRMACAIEDAGFEVREMLGWLFGSGFPKSHDVSRGIDRMLGGERPEIGPNRFAHLNGRANANVYGDASCPNETAPATDAAKQWQGWGTALKPAHEPICLARKPLIGTVAANVLKHGTGALNIDGCRIETAEALQGSTVRNDIRGGNFASGHKPNPGDIPAYEQSSLGRWPANIIHDGSDEVLAGFPAEAGATGQVRKQAAHESNSRGGFAGLEGDFPFHGDSGSAARFFYCAKATTDERGEGNNHPTVKPIDLMRWLCRLVTPRGGTVLDPFAGSGSTLVAADAEQFHAIGCELSPEYAAIAEARVRKSAGLFAEVRAA